MKRLLIISALLLFAGLAFGQDLQQGTLIGVHVLKVELKPGVTMDQYIKFFNEKFKPAWDKADQGSTIFLLKAIRGEHEGVLGSMVIFEDEAARDRYSNASASQTEYGRKIQEELAPINAELEKLGTWTSVYTDWLVQ